MLCKADNDRVRCAHLREEIMGQLRNAALFLAIMAIDRHFIVMDVERGDLRAFQQRGSIIDQSAIDRNGGIAGSKGQNFFGHHLSPNFSRARGIRI